MSTHSHSEEHHLTSYKTYILVWILLMVMTAITVYVSYVDLGLFNIVIAMSVASIKASVVALFFMHLKFEDGITWGVCSLSFKPLVLTNRNDYPRYLYKGRTLNGIKVYDRQNCPFSSLFTLNLGEPRGRTTSGARVSRLAALLW